MDGILGRLLAVWGLRRARRWWRARRARRLAVAREHLVDRAGDPFQGPWPPPRMDPDREPHEPWARH